MSNAAATNQTPTAPMVDVFVQEVKIYPDHVVIPIAGGMEKVVSLEDFRSLLNQALGQQEELKFDGFSLPSNVFYFGKSGTQIQISCYYQARVAEIQYYDKKMKVVMPNIIISHTLNKGGEKEWKVTASHYFCTDLSVGRLPREFINRIDHAKHIFLLPMSNTYESANMCFGSNTMPVRFVENNLRGLDWYYQYMFESPFNDDLGVIATGHRYRVNEWYSKLAKHAEKGEPFPYKELRGFTNT